MAGACYRLGGANPLGIHFSWCWSRTDVFSFWRLSKVPVSGPVGTSGHWQRWLVVGSEAVPVVGTTRPAVPAVSTARSKLAWATPLRV